MVSYYIEGLNSEKYVLILVLMEDGLVLFVSPLTAYACSVLILVLMEDGLVRIVEID